MHIIIYKNISSRVQWFINIDSGYDISVLKDLIVVVIACLINSVALLGEHPTII